jgi:hypothetical protein
MTDSPTVAGANMQRPPLNLFAEPRESLLVYSFIMTTSIDNEYKICH